MNEPLTITCRCNALPKLLCSLPEISSGVRVCVWCKSYFSQYGAQIDAWESGVKEGADALCAVEELPTILNL